MAEFWQLQTIYSVEDLYDMLEILDVEEFLTEETISEQEQNHKKKLAELVSKAPKKR